MTALTNFRLIAPEFSSESDETVNSFIALASIFIHYEAFADADLATALKSASLMLVRKNSASGASEGVITMEKEGDLQRSYSESTLNNGADIYQKMLNDLAIASGIGFGGITRMADMTPSL